MIRLLTLFALLLAGSAHAERARFATCEQFKDRLASAEKILGLPIPTVTFHDEGIYADTRHYSAELKGFGAELVCRKSGALDSFELKQTDDDKYLAPRFLVLATAAVWSYTNWTSTKAQTTVVSLINDAAKAVEASRIRGDQFDDGTAAIDLNDDIQIKISGGKSFGLYLIIDASVAP